MKSNIGRLALVSALALGALAQPCTAQTASARPKGLSAVEKAGEALQISNIMGRYSIYVVANRWIELGEMFALDEPDVRQNVPSEMSGPAVRKYFTDRAAAKVSDGVMHQHSFLAPIIEVAGDGQTAKGVWDSPGWIPVAATTWRTGLGCATRSISRRSMASGRSGICPSGRCGARLMAKHGRRWCSRRPAARRAVAARRQLRPVLRRLQLLHRRRVR
jgi:hypothetical protein